MARRGTDCRWARVYNKHVPNKMETLVDEKVWLGIYNAGNKRKR